MPGGVNLNPPQTAQQPQKDGWHFLTFQDGSLAIVNFENGVFKWGNVKEPSSQIVGSTYLGSTIDDITSSVGTANSQWSKALQGLPSKTVALLIGQLDTGQLEQGHPVVVDPSGTDLGGGTAQQAGGAIHSGAQETTGIPGANAAGSAVSKAVGSLTSPFGLFTSSGFWKGIGLVLAGGLILIFAALEFYRMSGG
jgi:hypothetical protein